MAIPVRTIGRHVEPGHPTIPETPDAPRLANPTVQAAMKITQSLQTTLDINAIIRFFYQALGSVVPLDGIEYRYPPLEIALSFGKRARHSCHYDLKIENQSLGEIVFRRRRAFTEADIADLEVLLCTLLYPMRNGILYREALSRARKDPLTGICNRAALDDALIQEVRLAHRHDTPLSLVVIDIDHFKRINDCFGHSVGDQALCTVVESAQKCVRNTDALFRYGGEEFVILLRNTDADGAELMAERLRKQIAKLKFSANGDQIKITISGGITALADNDNAKSLFKRADAALYAAKQGGRNRTERS
jgi:diguanylate cyclase (GGDEF)-like protein